MNTITHSQRYLPHEINTKFYAVKLYRSGVGVSFVCRRYHISKSSLLRWNKKFDGTKESLLDKSHRPLSKHPNAHTDEELKWIRDYHRRNPKISVCELYGKLRANKGYSRHPGSLYRIYRKLGYSSYAPSTKKKRKPQPYDTPTELGIKWQMDVKYVPTACYSGTVPQKFYQYTAIDEYSRFRYLEAFEEHSTYSSAVFLEHMLEKFPFKVECVQTDNGLEFTKRLRNTENPTPTLFESRLEQCGIKHKLIKPYTPRHNGKVERSHRKDNEYFYATHRFYSFEDFKKQLAFHSRKYNNFPMRPLNWKSPAEYLKAFVDNGEVF